MKNYLIFILLIFNLVSCTSEIDETAHQQIDGAVCLVSRSNVPLQMDDLSLRILDQNGNLYKQYSTGEIPQKILLKRGAFTLVIYSDNQETWQNANNGNGEPCYYATYHVNVHDEEVKRIVVDVPMINYAVTLKLPEYFNDLFPSYLFTLSSGERSLDIESGEKAYFDSQKGGFIYSLQATNTDGTTHSHSKIEYVGVESGKLYVVKYSYALDANRGSVDIEIENDMHMNDSDVEI
jgi:hypothetical protein